MKQPFVSIVIPTRRENGILKRCLDSLFRQNYPRNKFEIILISNNPLSSKIKGVKKIKAKNNNHAEARNLGVKKAKGEIIAFCDDDCILPPNWLSVASRYFVDKKFDLIGGPIAPPKETSFSFRMGAYLSGSKFAVGPSAPRWRKAYPEQKATPFNLILANTFVKKKCFKEVGGFETDQVPGEENLLYYKLQQEECRLLYTPKIACLHSSKPIFLPYARKVFFYSTGRGMLLAREPQSSHLAFWIPSFFVIGLLALPILALFSKWAFSVLIIMFSIYWGLSFAQALYIFWFRERDLKVFWAAPVATFLIHMAYGLGVLRGFLRYKLGKQTAFLMPDIPKA